MNQQVKMPGVVLNYRDVGQGEPLLFVHGFPLDCTMWQAQIDFFSKTHRCLAVDLRGFGRSSVRPGTVTMEIMADDLASFLDAIRVQGPVTLCGLSMGGYVAWQFWKRYPFKLSRLIMCDTRAIADTEEGAQQRLQTADKVEREGAAFLADSMLPKLYCEASVKSRPELIESARNVILTNSTSGIAAAARGMAARPDVTSWLPKIKVPTLLITGEHDAISSVAEMKTIANALPDARHAVIPHAGHMAPQEQPQATNAAIQKFLGETAK
ncbi:alpha/beta fold hydrolase [Planctomicrobium piriforme]|uniref:Pimeloyl-ACP methyl ester carboxylesterase n=1 Tax=Planctomicrobium piriforme TaxID=1576369 RepID=A0A1I3LBZ6_9PLAN|nr:alpha/beta fold hydrolase [Planctomicrobium piriforme]SFI82221.1 Pimeloyl-ACP methyl ester carboxylesterase [Planctomicrobium piriforme]